MNADIVDAVKRAVSDYSRSWAKTIKLDDDQQFCEVNGAITPDVAEQLGVDRKTAKRLLDKAAKDGLLCKSKHNGGRFCRWWPPGYLAELKSI